MDAILWKWITGAPMQYGRMFKDLMPRQDEVWEMKTPDLRIFGWLYRPRVFIAACLEYADWYKEPTKIKTYGATRNRVVAMRDALDLDEPKFATGQYDALV